MKKRIGQIFSLALVVVLVIAMAIPAHADVSDAAGYVVGEFWDMMTGKEYDTYFDYWKNFVGYLAGEECPSSPDKYHHGNVPVGGIGVFGSGGTDDNGKFVWHACDYCGEQFKVYASDLQQSYEAQVAELPAPGYSADGKLRWRLIINDISSNQGCSISSFTVGNSYSVIAKNSYSGAYLKVFYGSFVAPVDGAYQYLAFLNLGEECSLARWDTYVSTYLSSSSYMGGILSGSPSESGYVLFDCTQDFAKGETLLGSDGFFRLKYDGSSRYRTCSGYWEVLCTPVIPLSGDTYNINSRPTSITGDYGIIGDNGQIIKVEGDKIVNETNNTYYNPSTGETTTITDWSYNYEDRSYTVTTESGDTVTITYGDENVTIVEGDTTYNVYYLVNGSGSGDPGPGPEVCDHTWTETGRTDPSCTTAGKVTSTCSKCNQTKTEPIPATGHTWVVDRTVQTTYDEEGNLLQQGYTIYSCSVCGEQYKDMEGTGPPADDDIGDGGIIEFLEGLVRSLSENLHGVVELILSFFREIPPMFNGFLAFLTAMFPFLPPELMTLLSFGIAAVVLIGVIKAIRR